MCHDLVALSDDLLIAQGTLEGPSGIMLNTGTRRGGRGFLGLYVTFTVTTRTVVSVASVGKPFYFGTGQYSPKRALKPRCFIFSHSSSICHKFGVDFKMKWSY